MRATILAFLLLVAVVSAFVTVSKVTSSSSALLAKSKALPFVEAPAKLDGSMIGDNGFDPLGFTDTLKDLNYVRAAEIKHGRVAMLAVVGFVVPFHFMPSTGNPLSDVVALGYGPNLQILFAIGCIELATWKQTFSGSNGGDYNFDPMGQLKGKSAKDIDTLKLKELKNGRLAMVGIMGMIIEEVPTQSNTQMQTNI